MVSKHANVVVSTPGRFLLLVYFIFSVLDLMNLQLPRIAPEGEENTEEQKEEEGTQYLSIDRINYIVIDEADRMLDLGFKEQLNLMFSSLSPEQHYQIVCCSATNTDKVDASPHAPV